MKKITFLLITLFLFGCQDNAPAAPKSSSGVTKVSVKVPTNAQGITTEQKNVADRLLLDNKPGSIKHLYIISAYSGQTILYSTVRGKVTSSGKRLTPKTVLSANANSGAYAQGIKVNIGGSIYRTGEVLQDDGTYGNSIEYLYWWDSQGRYHQQYITGGMILHVSDQPISVKGVIINMEVNK